MEEREFISVNFPPKESGRYWCFCKELNDGGWFSYFQWNCAYSKEDNRWSNDNNEAFTVTHWTELLSSPC